MHTTSPTPPLRRCLAVLACLAFPGTALAQTVWTSFEDRQGHAMMTNPVAGGLVLFGGAAAGSGAELVGAAVLLNDTWQSTVAGEWLKLLPMNAPSPREAHGMAPMPAVNIGVLFGGRNPQGQALSDTWSWDGNGWGLGTVDGGPTARYAHAMATDTLRNRVVLFGGFDGSNPLNDTWEYDGTSWIDVSPMPATATNTPPRRFGHTMAFDPNLGRVVLFGGNGNKNDTWQWDGTTWTDVSPAPATATNTPAGRQDSAMAYYPVGNKVVLFGGSTSSGHADDTWEWDGTTWTECFPANKPEARFGHAVASDPTATPFLPCTGPAGVLVLVGGVGASGRALNGTWEWNSTDWCRRFPPPAARSNSPLAYDSKNQKVVMFGGVGVGGAQTQDTWELTGITWRNIPTTTSPPARDSHGLAYDSKRERTVLFGGDAGSCGSLLNDTWEWTGSVWNTVPIPGGQRPPGANGPLVYDAKNDRCVLLEGGDTWLYDGNAQSWAKAPVMAARFAPGAYDSVRDRVVVFGGAEVIGGFTDETWEWDGFRWIPRAPANSPPPRQSHAIAYDAARQRTVLFGGADTLARNDTWVWDGTNWVDASPTPATATNTPPARLNFSMTYDPVRQVVLMFGGGGVPCPCVNDTWEWDGTTWTQRFPTNSPSARCCAPLAFNAASGRVMLFGGNDGTQYSDTWEFDSDASGGLGEWKLLTPATTSPSVRHGHRLWYDPTLGGVVLFGGFSVTATRADTWAWDGADWAQLAPSMSPSARSSYVLAYDSSRNRAVFFGGVVGTTFFSDTWEWDGTDWGLLASATSPPARSHPGMAYDSSRGRVVVHGGEASCGSATTSNDTWEWDGTSWIEQFPAQSPPKRSGAQLAYDELRGRVVLFGGVVTGVGRSNNTWEWDGTDWIARFPANSPPPLSGHGMAFDAGRGLTVLFGGDSNAGPVNDTWDYGASVPAAYTTYGTGCVASTGLVPTLSLAGRPPWVGDVLSLSFGNLPGPGFVWIGLARFPAPGLELTFLGSPGCHLHSTILVLLPIVSGGWSLQLPVDPSSAGFIFYNQAVALDGANPLVFTNGGEATLQLK